MNLKKSQNRKNKSRLHKYRNLILEMHEEQHTLKQIAEKIEEIDGEKFSLSLISRYLKNYPAESEKTTKPVAAKSTEIVTKPTTEKEIEPSSVTKHAADDVFSSVEESRAESQADFITPNGQEVEPENQPENSKNPFRKLTGKVGKTKPDIDDKTNIF